MPCLFNVRFTKPHIYLATHYKTFILGRNLKHKYKNNVTYGVHCCMRVTASAVRVSPLLRPVCYWMTKNSYASSSVRPSTAWPCGQIVADFIVRPKAASAPRYHRDECILYCHAIIIARQKTHVCPQPQWDSTDNIHTVAQSSKLDKTHALK